MFPPIIKQDVAEIITTTKKDLLKLQGKRILITGASGFLARYLVYTLLEANKTLLKKPVKLYLVVRSPLPDKLQSFRLPGGDRMGSPGVARSAKRPMQNWHQAFRIWNHPTVTYLYLDIAKTVPHVSKINYIIHAASPSAPKHYMNDMINTLNVNILGTYNLINASDKNLKSFLFISSGEVYGSNNKEQVSRPEGVPTNAQRNEHLLGRGRDGIWNEASDQFPSPRSCYVEGKRAAEAILMNYFWEKNLPVKIARLFHTYGPGINLDDGRALSDFLKDGLAGRDIAIKGNKNLTRPFLYIKDATIMFIKLLLSNKNGEVYNIADDKNIISIETLAEMVANIFNKTRKKKIEVTIKNKNKKYYQNAPLEYEVDISKFKRDFGFHPITTLKQGIKRTIANLR